MNVSSYFRKKKRAMHTIISPMVLPSREYVSYSTMVAYIALYYDTAVY